MVQFQSTLTNQFVEHTFAAMAPQFMFVVEGGGRKKFCTVFEPRTSGAADIMLTSDSPALLKEKFRIFKVVDSRRAVFSMLRQSRQFVCIVIGGGEFAA